MLSQKLIFTLFSFILLLNITGCNNSTKNTSKVELTVAAASDLTLAFSEIGKLFEEETGTKVTFSFGSTGQLADQIENGAPFDVFAAANKKFIENLDEKNLLISDTMKVYAFGRIGLATRADSSLNVENIEQLLKPEVTKVAIANPDHAPYGTAAKQALETAGIWDQLENKLVYGRNISDTLTYIETGNAEVAIIALSLVVEDKVNFSIIDDHMHAPLEQMIAVNNSTKQEEAAREFINFIFGPIGKPIMERYGFIVPTE
ncbi:molybdate ABC transporter substrate-binding protein [Anaerobacillus arseniciselenatis]|uniref:Molybdate ABC transporter substrate-binding protein n=1 Tax=Anaerobacillus arseniciselenatis TaxID=85682 RepID=A0A1S2L8U7_9BACI|nr:molybdate ABC transporter substrate-binding protein [Anaerobacillus arseniciselenatis]OIJ08413.1 molybdate ABC transporter substrate-binding protein [Anaerobacillus arseniciselenatis]